MEVVQLQVNMLARKIKVWDQVEAEEELAQVEGVQEEFLILLLIVEVMEVRIRPIECLQEQLNHQNQIIVAATVVILLKAGKIEFKVHITTTMARRPPSKETQAQKVVDLEAERAKKLIILSINL